MSDLLSSLKRDHVNASRLILVMRQQFERLESGQVPDWHLLAEIMRYMVEYGDLFHHRAEDAVYERLRRKDGAAQPDLDEIAREHSELEQEAARCRRLVEAATADTDVHEELLAAGKRYLDDLEAHMYKEEKRLFPLIRLLLTPADWEAIERCVADRDDPLFGKTVQDGYRKILQHFEQDASVTHD